jgi:hypothetical protein
MAEKKAKKKTSEKKTKVGVEIKSEPAIVEEPVYSVRTVTGVRKMTESEYKKHIKANK